MHKTNTSTESQRNHCVCKHKFVNTIIQISCYSYTLLASVHSQKYSEPHRDPVCGHDSRETTEKLQVTMSQPICLLVIVHVLKAFSSGNYNQLLMFDKAKGFPRSALCIRFFL